MPDIGIPLFSDYLIHFCGRRSLADYKLHPIDEVRKKCYQVLEEILVCSYLKSSECPIFYDPNGQLDRQELQRRGHVVCFTDLRFQDIAEHVDQFGRYGIALKKESEPSTSCFPVQYVAFPSYPETRMAQLEEQVKYLLDEPNVPAHAKTSLGNYVRERWLEMQDIVNRSQNEWRWIADWSPDGHLPFEPEDVAFVFVDTPQEAIELNKRFQDSDDQLRKYGDASVMAVPIQLLIEGQQSRA